jgi:hypothetical protein
VVCSIVLPVVVLVQKYVDLYKFLTTLICILAIRSSVGVRIHLQYMIFCRHYVSTHPIIFVLT